MLRRAAHSFPIRTPGSGRARRGAGEIGTREGTLKLSNCPVTSVSTESGESRSRDSKNLCMSQQLHTLYYAAVSALHYRFWVLQTFSLLLEINSNIMKIRAAAACISTIYISSPIYSARIISVPSMSEMSSAKPSSVPWPTSSWEKLGSNKIKV